MIGIILGGLFGLLLLTAVFVAVSSSSRVNKSYDIPPDIVAVHNNDDVLARGRHLFEIGCADCHGANFAHYHQVIINIYRKLASFSIKETKMKNWFNSLNGAITLSVIALLTELWRGFLDAMFVFPNDIGEERYMHLAALIYVFLFALWTWSLISAASRSRRGLIAAFIINLVIWLMIPVSTLLFYCPVDCLADAGWIFSLANTLNLLFGLLAAVALGLQLRRGPEATLHTSEAQ